MPRPPSSARRARIVGTETTFHLLVAFGVDPGQISVVRGEELLDFDGITAQVHRKSPTSRIVVPDYRTTYGADMRVGTSMP
ncbi:hypothetical protein ACH4LE_27610 [Streptomyces sp. NPDC017413]|uniref:hypothetical protein n=1 Tax=Streptomyces sp. NPDC017413 TaxID=3364994 RepID=UPI00378EDB07